MKSFSELTTKYFWFAGGFAIGITLISLGHAALPKRATPPTYTQKQQSGSLVSEMKGGKVNSPDLDHDFAQLNAVERKYAENWEQQQRIKNATGRVARSNLPLKKSAR